MDWLCTCEVEREYIVQLQKHFINSLESIISNYDNNIFDVDILDKDEQFEIMRSSSGEKIELKPNTTIIDYFYQNVLDYPDKIALLLKDKSFTFQELNSLSNQCKLFFKVPFGVFVVRLRYLHFVLKNAIPT